MGSLGSMVSHAWRLAMTDTAYDRLPYACVPVEWTAPERLAVAALLHGGPRSPQRGYRVLELGCGNGANLLPLAYYRRHSQFIGVDYASTQCRVAEARARALELDNVRFIHADFAEANALLEGSFDFIIGHGIISWVAPATRDRLLALCKVRLADRGLLYLSYNALPGWSVRGLVRDFLLARTQQEASLLGQAAAAQDLARALVPCLESETQPFARLMAAELQLVRDGHASYIAHEYLAAHNHPYWRSEFNALASSVGLAHVADADFNYGSGRVAAELPRDLHRFDRAPRDREDIIDLLSHRQFICSMFTHAPFVAQPATIAELAELHVAACLRPTDPAAPMSRWGHPSGYEVDVSEPALRSLFAELSGRWPRGRRMGALAECRDILDDILLLQRNGLLELRRADAGEFEADAGRLRELEAQWSGYSTTAYHTRVAPLG